MTLPATVTLKGIWAAAIALTFAIVVALLVVQTVRLEGFKLWPFEIEGCLAKSERLQGDIDRVKAAQVDALKKAQEAKETAEENYRELAEETDEKLEQARASAMDAAERYIAAHRVRPETVDRSAGRTAPAAGDHGTEGSDGPRAPPELAVIVEAEDIRICTENTIRLEATRDWALDLIGEGD